MIYLSFILIQHIFHIVITETQRELQKVRNFFFFFCNIVFFLLKRHHNRSIILKTISLSSCLRELNLLFGHTCRGHLRLFSAVLPHCPLYFPVTAVHAHARTRVELETKGGRARAKTTCSRDWGREARALYSTRRRYSRLFARQRSRALTLHTHTPTFQRKKKKKKLKSGRWCTNSPPHPRNPTLNVNWIWLHMGIYVEIFLHRGLPYLPTYSWIKRS